MRQWDALLLKATSGHKARQMQSFTTAVSPALSPYKSYLVLTASLHDRGAVASYCYVTK